jgi:hypothetical protein
MLNIFIVIIRTIYHFMQKEDGALLQFRKQTSEPEVIQELACLFAAVSFSFCLFYTEE